MKAIIIEDEPLSVAELRNTLSEVAPHIEIVATASSVAEAVELLPRIDHDLLFMDIHLGDGNGFDIFRRTPVNVPVIFITAYDTYAMRAFENKGIDYLLKPFGREDLRRAIDKLGLLARVGAGPTAGSSDPASAPEEAWQERFLVQIGARMRSVTTAEIAYFMADGKYLHLVTHDGKDYLLDRTLTEVGEKLSPRYFFRINRRLIISFESIREMVRYSGSRIKVVLQPPLPEGEEAPENPLPPQGNAPGGAPAGNGAELPALNAFGRNLTDLALSENQTNLIKELAKTGKPIVMILNEGRPRLINPIEPLAKAIVNIMLPGNYGGDALANLLAGDANFSGKMPFTYPKHPHLLTVYDYKPCENMGQMGGNYNYDAVMDVQWPFGFGLSYTTYKYSNLKVDKTSFNADDELTFTVDVTNTGKMAGKESVLLFTKDMVASSSPDNIRLRNFTKISLNPGETKTVTLKIKGSDLAFVNYEGKWTLEKGDFKAKCGDQWIDFQCNQTKIWDTPNK